MTDNQYQADGHDNTQNAAGAPYVNDGAERSPEGAAGAQPQYIEQPEAAPPYAGQPGAGGYGAGAEAAHAANAPGAPPFYGEQPGAANSTPYYADQPGAAGAYGAPAYYTDQSGPAGAAGAAPQTREEWERQQREIQDREWQNRQQMYNRQLADARTVQAQQWRQPWPPYGDGRYADRRQPDQYAQGRPNYAPPYQDGRFYYDAGQPQGAPQQGVPPQQQDTRGKSKKRKAERQGGRKPFMQIIAAGLAGALIASAVFISGYFVGNSGFFKNAAVAQPLAGADASAADDSGRQDAQPAQPPNDGGGQSGGLGGLFKIPQDRLPLLPPAGQQPGVPAQVF